MKVYRLWFLLCSMTSVLGSDYSQLYTPFQRDVMFFIDFSSFEEHVSYTFAQSGANLDVNLPAVTAQFAAGFYSASVPIIVTSSVVDGLFERAQILIDAQNLSEKDFGNTYSKKYQGTLLGNIDELRKFQQLCKIAYKTLTVVNKKIGAAFKKSKNINEVIGNLDKILKKSNEYKKTLDTIKANFTTPMAQGVVGLLLSFIMVQKILTGKNDWILRKTDQCIYIMIPKSYLEGVRKQVAAFNQAAGSKSIQDVLANSLKNDKGRSLTPDELMLGIKFEDFQPLDFTAVSKKVCQDVDGADSAGFISQTQANGVKNFKGTLADIIINANDFATFTEDQFSKRSETSWIPHYYQWNVYGIGHGSEPSSPNAITMGLTILSFQAFLDFFDSINTAFLFYMSCYSGGAQVRSVYMDQELKRLKEFHYTIALGALADAPIAGQGFSFKIAPEEPLPSLDYIDITTQSIKPSLETRFGKFFSDLHGLTRTDPITGEKKPITYEELFLNIGDFKNNQNYTNIPQIKFPGSLWFNVIDLGPKMIRLTRTFVRTRDAEVKAGRLKELVIKDKDLLLIDAETPWGPFTGGAYSEIPFPLKIEGSMPTVVSMVMGEAYHAFQKIDVADGFTNVIDKFWGLMPESPRTYFIKELVVKNNLTDKSAKIIGAQGKSVLTLNNVAIFANAPIAGEEDSPDKMIGILFQYNNTWYAFAFSSQDSRTVNKVRSYVSNNALPNIAEIAAPELDQYRKQVKDNFEVETKMPSLKAVVKFMSRKAKHVKLADKYEEKKKAGKKALEEWKKTLSASDKKFIDYYEAMDKAREAQSPASAQTTK